jgi:hypothetical protein
LLDTHRDAVAMERAKRIEGLENDEIERALKDFAA